MTRFCTPQSVQIAVYIAMITAVARLNAQRERHENQVWQVLKNNLLLKVSF